MNEIKNQNEQRKHKRFLDPHAAAAVLTLKSWSKLGLITEISRGGLAFRYLDNKTVSEEVPVDCAEVKIIWK